MNELPTTSDKKTDTAGDSASTASNTTAAASSATPDTRQPAGKASSGLLHAFLIGGLAILALLFLAHWWNTQREIGGLREDVAQRLRSGETAFAETRVMVKAVHENLKELQAKVNVLESKQAEAQSQQLALEQLYQDLARTRDDWLLAEIEQVLSTASQQLQLAGNVQGAVIALQTADARLARADTPQFARIRNAIANDLERLKELPSFDLTAAAMRLDSAIDQVDRMPLLSDEKPAAPATDPKVPRQARNETNGTTPSAGGGNEGDWLARVENAWHSWTNELWSEIKQVVRVRSVQEPDALLLSPSQAYYARENLKLRLLNARLALITRNERAFRSDLIAAQDAIARYFDTRAKQTQTVQALLRQVQASNLAVEMPTLSESLNALRNYKAQP